MTISQVPWCAHGSRPPEKPLLRSNHVIGECMLCPHAIQFPPEPAQYPNKVCVECALEVAGLSIDVARRAPLPLFTSCCAREPFRAAFISIAGRSTSCG